MAQYWVLDWLDKEGVGNATIAYGVLRTREGMQRFISAADGALEQGLAPQRQANSIIAGGALSLEGKYACSDHECLENTVDQLIMTTWHYFERIVVTGLDPQHALDIVETEPNRTAAAATLLEHISAALHVRNLDAEDLFYFQRPVRRCVHHLDQHAHEAGLASAVQVADELSKELRKGYTLHLTETRFGQEYAFSHPALTYVTTGRVKKRKKKAALAESIAKYTANGLTATLIRDAALAREVRAPLGQLTSVNSKVLTPAQQPISSADVAFRLNLPTIRGLDAADIILFRKEHPDEFSVFRAAVKKTIEERMKALPSEDSEAVADSVVHDVLEPALADLRKRLEASRKLLRAGSVATFTTGGLVTGIGLMTFAPVVVPGLVVAAGGVLSGIRDYQKERRDAQMSDLHFLWRVSNAAAGRH